MLFNALRSGNLQDAIVVLALSLPAVVLCLSIHEAAHGGMASALGDRTARDAGRVTLSPLAHIDPFGFLCLLLFGFGWARPVPVNISNFKNRRWGMALTAIAGPLSNLLTAFVFFCLYIVAGTFIPGTFGYVVMRFCLVVANMSVGLGVFNLIPVHPLDGSRVLDAFLPFSWSLKLQKYQSVILLVFVVALWFGWLDGLMAAVSNQIAGWALRFMGILL